jgi:hypothetical protein
MLIKTQNRNNNNNKNKHLNSCKSQKTYTRERKSGVIVIQGRFNCEQAPTHQTKKCSQRFKEEAFNLVTIDDGLRLVSSSSEDDDDEVQSLSGVSLFLSLSHTHTDMSSD